MLRFGRASRRKRDESRVSRGRFASCSAMLGVPLRTGAAHVVTFRPIRTENIAEQRMPRHRDVAEAKSGTALKIRHGGVPLVRFSKQRRERH
jgi:hypothetical protein